MSEKTKLTRRDHQQRHRDRVKALQDHLSKTGGNLQIELAWVAKNLRKGNTPSQASAPSPVAWNLYEECNEDEVTRRAFWAAYMKPAAKDNRNEQAIQKDEERRITRIFEELDRDRPDHLRKVERSRVEVQREKAGRVPVVASAGQAQVQA